MDTDSITPLLITYNEEPNLGRTLAQLAWARQIIIIDSGSTDGTLSIAGTHSQVRVVSRSFDSFANQCNFGLAQISTEWTLSLDADYVLTDELLKEIRAIETETDCYSAPFIYCVHGRRLRASLYPRRIVLYRTRLAHYRDEGHRHRVHVSGNVGALRSPILHDDRKSVARWLSSQYKYAIAEADYILCDGNILTLNDRVRRMIVLAPLSVFVYVLIGKRCLLDGWPGVFYALQRLIAESLLGLELLDRKLSKSGSLPPAAISSRVD